MEQDILVSFAKLSVIPKRLVLTVNKNASVNKEIILVVTQLVANAIVNLTGKVLQIK